MAVHDDVEQPVQQRTAAEVEQVAVVLPAPDHLLDVEHVVVADRHDAARQDEGRDLREPQTGVQHLVRRHRTLPGMLEVGRVDADEGVVGVHRRLRPAGVLDDVLDRVAVQALVGQFLQDAMVRFQDVDPDQGILLLEAVQMSSSGKILVRDLALAPKHRVDAGGSHEGSVLSVTGRQQPMTTIPARLITIGR